MKFPNGTDLSGLNRNQVINLLLASIGFEELALGYLVKSEADLLQMALGKLPVNGSGNDGPMVKSINDLLRLNRSINNTLQTITNKERLLLLKLREVADLIGNVPALENLCFATAATGEAVVEAAYINEEKIGFNVTVNQIDLFIGENCTTENDRIQLRFSHEACPFASITLVENTANIFCNSAFNTALISASVNVDASNNQLDGEYNAVISLNENGNMTIFLENEQNRLLFKITGAVVDVEECQDEGLEPANNCACSVTISTNQNTVITVTGENVFFPATISNLYIDVPCNCDAANSTMSVVIREDFIQILIPGEFEDGTISTVCDVNEAVIQAGVILGGVFYRVYILANRDGTVTATFEGSSTFTITLTGANVAISGC
ncbi:hypothetical protein ACN6MT_19140 [Neobacillus niacini]|uniref:hypothetical protein n=1 Tax=Neobacillus niacini TaxID=86668 RepID=UPI003B017467